ncbi:ADP-ribose pyrophosphatase YjhB (NUDIX family) [Nonomuraea thailandensis]|uniref:ADP-ribose pyrophosphatase YjhB (NUDIX family) n=1 Tax=Nonomuraea thailandensis TaxID=1188745 RepID=A0A9X2K6J3_9ACTN|nr:NUDIX domain-containing protein [Nonomuraea thailandensis]MCP2362632.1 ADP-ribose pyrophosphatase YjhB (NUDIX family) [Nonomuraea thailandensis]
MNQDSRHSVSVAGVIVDDQGRALLIQRRDNGHWEAPGGVLELNEDIVSGLRREVREETGLEIEPELLTGVYKNMKHGIVALVFRCHAVGGSLTASEESKAFRWVTADEARALSVQAFAVRVIDAMTSDGKPAVREHDGVHIVGLSL